MKGLAYAACFQHMAKAGKEMLTVVWLRACLRLVLETENGPGLVLKAFQGHVIEVDMGWHERIHSGNICIKIMMLGKKEIFPVSSLRTG